LKKDLSKTGIDRYFHPHNLIYINYRNHYNHLKIESHKLGKNICEKMKDVDLELTEKFSDCNGCRKYIKQGFRFLCLNCVPGFREDGYNDICDKCFNILKDSNHKKYKSIVNNLKLFEHDQDLHAFLKIYYNKTYFDY